jgi:DNA-binding transcriptional regulator YdaS (Cro superfamily)
MTRNTDVLLGSTTTTLIRWVKAKRALPDERVSTFLTSPSLNSARRFVSALDGIVHLYVTTASTVAPEQEGILDGILHLELASVCAGGWIGGTSSVGEDVSIALAAKTRDWLADLQASGRINAMVNIAPLAPKRTEHGASLSLRAMGYVSLAGLDRWSEERRESNYRERLGRIQSLLGIRRSELARILGVTPEAVRQWFDGAPISSDRHPDIDRINAVVDELAKIFRPEALPSLVRRRVPVLGNRTPLELILAGREDEVIRAYQQLFRPGVTQ